METQIPQTFKIRNTDYARVRGLVGAIVIARRECRHLGRACYACTLESGRVVIVPRNVVTRGES